MLSFCEKYINFIKFYMFLVFELYKYFILGDKKRYFDVENI